jgi:hypothetical protein
LSSDRRSGYDYVWLPDYSPVEGRFPSSTRIYEDSKMDWDRAVPEIPTPPVKNKGYTYLPKAAPVTKKRKKKPVFKELKPKLVTPKQKKKKKKKKPSRSKKQRTSKQQRKWGG